MNGCPLSFRLAALAILSSCLSMPLAAQPAPVAQKPTVKSPLVIAEQGNFYAGGRRVTIEKGTILADAMFVEYQIPADQKHPYPLVFFHGGASSGAYFWSTPDGREGWATQFLRMGYSVYVVDRPTLGRSPHYEPVDGSKVLPPLAMPEVRPGMVVAPPVKPATRHAMGATSGPSGFSSIEVPFGAPGDPLMISTYVDRIDRQAGAALLDRIGPAILVTHSRAGSSGWQIADARPDLVKAIVAVEPNGPPFFNAQPLGQPGDAVARPFGITYGPLAFSPPVSALDDFGQLEQMQPRDGYSVGCWVTKGEMPQLVRLAGIPVLMVSGGASYHAAYDHCTADFLRKAGVGVEHVNLDEAGITGNTHGMMGETNNGQIASLISDWLSGLGD